MDILRSYGGQSRTASARLLRRCCAAGSCRHESRAFFRSTRGEVDAVELIEAVGEGIEQALLGLLIAETADSCGCEHEVVSLTGDLQRDGPTAEVAHVEGRAGVIDPGFLD